MRMSSRFWLIPALFLLYGAPPTWAMLGDTVMLNAAYTRETDSNLFFLPANANFIALIGKPSAEETIDTTSLGFSVNKPYSLQRIELAVDVIDYRYQNFSYLGFTAHNYNATWRWELPPRLSGYFTTYRIQNLNSFLDYQNFTTRNVRSTVNRRFEAAYELQGTWSLVGGVMQTTQVNEQAVPGQGDYTAFSEDVGLRYIFASGSSLNYTFKKTNGTYLNPTPLSDDGFSQIDNGFHLQWIVSGQSTADFGVAYISRTHPHYSQLDFSGFNIAANFNWRITGKSALTAGWTRELSSYQTADTTHTQTEHFSVGPVWQVSPKTAVRVTYVLTLRDYLSSPTPVPTTQRTDTLRDTRLSFDWLPYQRLTFSASLQKSSRTSTLPNLGYDNTLASLSAQLAY
jgi:exopolysaccharide biosynthesis operon protein EpsL